MFEKFMRAAERAADGVSRREFFGRLGRGAAVVAAAAAGVAATAGDAQAAGTCNPGGSSSCRGKPVGSTCFYARGIGTCKTFNKQMYCSCYANGR